MRFFPLAFLLLAVSLPALGQIRPLGLVLPRASPLVLQAAVYENIE